MSRCVKARNVFLKRTHDRQLRLQFLAVVPLAGPENATSEDECAEPPNASSSEHPVRET